MFVFDNSVILIPQIQIHKCGLKEARGEHGDGPVVDPVGAPPTGSGIQVLLPPSVYKASHGSMGFRDAPSPLLIPSPHLFSSPLLAEPLCRDISGPTYSQVRLISHVLLIKRYLRLQ